MKWLITLNKIVGKSFKFLHHWSNPSFFGSISPTFYEQLLRVQIPKARKDCQVRERSLVKSSDSFCSFGIFVRKIRLTKLTPCVNFINILHTLFLTISWSQKMSNPKHSFLIFGIKIPAQNVHVKCWWNRFLVIIDNLMSVNVKKTAMTSTLKLNCG